MLNYHFGHKSWPPPEFSLRFLDGKIMEKIVTCIFAVEFRKKIAKFRKILWLSKFDRITEITEIWENYWITEI